MNLVYIGKIVNTHGIKGELRLLSDFEYKDRIFNNNSKIYIDNKEYIINSYRHHKIFDMITLKGFNDINEVLFLKNKKVYCKRSNLNLNKEEYLISDLIGLNVIYEGKEVGKLTSVELGKNPLMIINEKILIPYNKNFIETIDLLNKKIILKNCEGLL